MFKRLKQNYRLQFGTLIILICAFACNTDPNKAYFESVKQSRLQKNKELLEANGPFTDSSKQHFLGLKYFEIDPTYRIEADIDILAQPELVTLSTPDNKESDYQIFAKAKFQIEGKDQVLSLFKQVRKTASLTQVDESIFLPFYDLTNESTSYSGGRYLYPEYNGGNKIILDFNLASNPFCAYNHKYSCTLPPTENSLSVEIKAGEKLYK